MRQGLIGITGGIGSGKSSVSLVLSRYCYAPFIDVDQCCRHLLDIGQPGYQAIQETFGSAYLDANSCIDRVALRSAIFANDTIRRKVDSIIHPLARQVVQKTVRSLLHPLVFIEVPLLFEAGWQRDVTESVVVYAQDNVRLKRIIYRDNVAESAALQAINSQMMLDKKARLGDHVIDNSCSWFATWLQVVPLARKLQKRYCRSQ